MISIFLEYLISLSTHASVSSLGLRVLQSASPIELGSALNLCEKLFFVFLAVEKLQIEDMASARDPSSP